MGSCGAALEMRHTSLADLDLRQVRGSARVGQAHA